MLPNSLEPVLVSDSIRLLAGHVGDRYAHAVEIFAADRGEFMRVLESVEGASDDRWPASPPWQELHTQPPQVAFCVGRAGKSHWSLSVSLEREGRELLWDVACRTGEAEPQLTSSYRLLADAATAPSGGEASLGGLGVLRIGPVDDAEWVWQPSEPRILTLRATAPPAPRPVTVRWRYRVVAGNQDR